MAAPQRRYRASAKPRLVAQPVQRQKAARRAGGSAARRKAAGRFAVVVVIPVLLMLGSVYLHTVSAGLTDKVASLEDRLAELSGAGRIRSLAIEKLGMKDPGGANLEVYDVNREDGERDGGEKEGGKSR